jgi:YVTN family beta-propeller protein
LKLFILLALLISSTSFAQAQIQLIREKRVQSFSAKTSSPNDIFDRSINSPKSALFSEDGRKLYINSLEGGQTVVYQWPSLQKIKVIDHLFNSRNQNLFQNGEQTVFNYPYYKSNLNGANFFRGKPVEMTLSHAGRFLWITYYRRDFDTSGQSPSAVAIVDTNTDEILRVMPTGPIPKYVAISPDGQTAAITHWGDNTVALIDISSGSPQDFTYTKLLTVERQVSQADKGGTDRDATCGFCLRGTVFSPDSRFLFVARMGGGGIAGFDLLQNRYLGTIINVRATPRHLLISPDQKKLISSSNVSGYVSIFSLDTLTNELMNANGQRVRGTGAKEISVGSGARTIEIEPNGKYVYVAVNNDTKVVAIDLETSKVVSEVKVDPFPVGLAISKDGSYIAVTSQGHAGRGGGNAVNIIRVVQP